MLHSISSPHTDTINKSPIRCHSLFRVLATHNGHLILYNIDFSSITSFAMIFVSIFGILLACQTCVHVYNASIRSWIPQITQYTQTAFLFATINYILYTQIRQFDDGQFCLINCNRMVMMTTTKQCWKARQVTINNTFEKK